MGSAKNPARRTGRGSVLVRTTEIEDESPTISSVPCTPRRNHVIRARVGDELTQVLVHVGQRHRDVRVGLHLTCHDCTCADVVAGKASMTTSATKLPLPS